MTIVQYDNTTIASLLREQSGGLSKPNKDQDGYLVQAFWDPVTQQTNLRYVPIGDVPLPSYTPGYQKSLVGDIERTVCVHGIADLKGGYINIYNTQTVLNLKLLRNTSPESTVISIKFGYSGSATLNEILVTDHDGGILTAYSPSGSVKGVIDYVVNNLGYYEVWRESLVTT